MLSERSQSQASAPRALKRPSIAEAAAEMALLAARRLRGPLQSQLLAFTTPVAPHVVRHRCLMLVSPPSASTASEANTSNPAWITAGHLLRHPEARREEKSADAAGHADEPGHDPDLVPKPLRHELKHRAVPHAEREHACREQSRAPCTRCLRPEADDDRASPRRSAYMVVSVLMPPMRSASAPPMGRTSEPTNTQPAVK